MKQKHSSEKVLGYAGSVSGGATILGSAQLCHSICLGVISLLSVIGITVTGMPLAFMQKVSIPFWILAVVLLAITGVISLRHKCMSRKLLVANSGLVIAGTPFGAVQPYISFFWIAGGILVAGSIGAAINDRINSRNDNSKNDKKRVAKKRYAALPETTSKLLGIGIIVVLAIILVNTVLLVRITGTQPQIIDHETPREGTNTVFPVFDQNMAHEFMDKNKDGMCDTCGMSIEDCMKMGMMECSMGDAQIGLLGSAHTHVDWKIYINGKQMDLQKFAVPNSDATKTSKFVHVEAGPSPEMTGDVLHIHATGIPLSLFFESVGLEFNDKCIGWTENEYCSDAQSTLKFFVNGEKNTEKGQYVPKNGDKILISYGPKNENVTKQLESITDFVHTHYSKDVEEDEDHEH